MRTLTISTMVALTVAGALGALAGGAHVGACERLLEVAQEASRHSESLGEVPKLYAVAFERCDEEELSPEVAARVAWKRAEMLHLYGQDADRALEIYEQGLADVTSSAGLDSPGRIALLDGIAQLLEERVADGRSAKPATDEERVLNLRKESLEVRRTVYGDRSAEAVRGLNLLTLSYLRQQPNRAEELAKEAIEIAVSDPDLTEAAAESYSVLATVYGQMGRTDDEEDAMERAGEFFDRVYPSDG
jgi:tetratricopeptide (TPR) repeat protein